MPRASNGTYTLPAGNPVVTNTVISSVWANSSLSDIATEMTDSLDRSGKGPMLAGLQLFDGLIGSPGLTWGTETTSGLYRAGAGDHRYSLAAVDKLQITTNGLRTADGVVGTPGLSFIADPDTGFYRRAVNVISASSGGVLVLDIANPDGVNLQVGAFQAPVGAVGTPTFTFLSDPDTGVYHRLANTISFSAGGTLAADITVASVRSIGTQGYIVDSDGSAGSPAYSWTSDSDTGFYRAGANALSIAAGGVQALQVSDAVYPLLQVRATAAGSPATPDYSWNGDTDSGMFRAGANDVRISVGGVANLQILTAQVAALVPYTNADGAVGAPSFSFFNDPDNGLYRIGANDWGLSAGGALQLELNAGSSVALRSIALHAFADGSAALPSQSYISDFDTGFYHDTANQIAIALGGVTAGQIAQGTFTITYTGMTAATTGTATYQIHGKLVILTLPSLVGTSNSTSFTMTGLAAAIRPTTTQQICMGASDNSALQSGIFGLVDSGGTITMYKTASATGWTAAGSKGTSNGTTLCYYLI